MASVQGTAPLTSMPIMAGEDMRLHDAVQFWESVQTALAHVGLLKSAMGLVPDEADQIVDLDLSSLPVLPPEHPQYYRQLETMLKVKAQNKSNRKKRYAIIMKQRTAVYTMMHKSAETMASWQASARMRAAPLILQLCRSGEQVSRARATTPLCQTTAFQLAWRALLCTRCHWWSRLRGAGVLLMRRSLRGQRRALCTRPPPIRLERSRRLRLELVGFAVMEPHASPGSRWPRLDSLATWRPGSERFGRCVVVSLGCGGQCLTRGAGMG